MKKFILAVCLTVGIGVAGSSLKAAETPAPPANPVEQFTGKYWVETSEVAKEAYLYGLESAIAVEYSINAKLAEDARKARKKPASFLSPFERGWIKAFRDTTRKQIMTEVDQWYASHPDNLDRPVLDVIWYELIDPKLGKTTR